MYGFGQDEGGVLGETIISSSSSAEELGGHSGDTVLPCLARGHGKHGVENRSWKPDLCYAVVEGQGRTVSSFLEIHTIFFFDIYNVYESLLTSFLKEI